LKNLSDLIIDDGVRPVIGAQKRLALDKIPLLLVGQLLKSLGWCALGLKMLAVQYVFLVLRLLFTFLIDQLLLAGEG
jgi:hypothetical protein